MLHQPSINDKKEFRSFVLHLKNLNPSWEAKDISKFLRQSQNPPSYTTKKALRFKVWRILKRNQVNDLPRPGAPRTTTTTKYVQAVKKTIELKKNASIRNVNAKLRRQGYKTSINSVWRAKTELNLQWWKRQTVQKLTNEQKVQRVIIAKKLRKNYGTKKGGKSYKWNYVLNTDFSGAFPLSPKNNHRNEGIYAEWSIDIPYELRTIQKQKFQKSVMLWGGISYNGLFPKESPIFVDEWLQLNRSQGGDRRKKIYFTGDKYAKFIQTIVADEAAKELGDLRNVIFQDDQDRKQRMQVVLNTVKRVFINRIEPKDCDAKLADVWPIENVWGALKEHLRGREYNNIEQLKSDIKKEWKKFSVLLCQEMMDKIPARLKLVIDQGGNQIREH